MARIGVRAQSGTGVVVAIVTVTTGTEIQRHAFYEEMKDEMQHCERLMKHMKRIYLRETNLPEAKLDKLMKRDLYLSYKKCVKYGIEK